jgi:hypothetical protein
MLKIYELTGKGSLIGVFLLFFGEGISCKVTAIFLYEINPLALSNKKLINRWSMHIKARCYM